MKTLLLLTLIFALAVPGLCADVETKADSTAITDSASTSAKTVTLDAKDKPVAEVLKEISNKTGTTILAEKLVTGDVTVSIKDADVDKALGAVKVASGMQWKKVYVPKDSVYVKDGDALATQVRLLLGLKFPDIVVVPSSSYDPVVHLQKESTASTYISKIDDKSGLSLVYLITNDKAYTKKAVAADAKEKAQKYTDLSKEAMDLFMSMTPEERLEAMRQGVQMQMQLGPDAMKQLMETVMQMDPEYLAETNSKAMQALMDMDAAARRNMLKSSMRSQFKMMQSMNKEQMQQFQKEAMEVAKELMESGEITAPTPMPGQ